MEKPPRLQGRPIGDAVLEAAGRLDLLLLYPIAVVGQDPKTKRFYIVQVDSHFAPGGNAIGPTKGEELFVDTINRLLGL